MPVSVRIVHSQGELQLECRDSSQHSWRPAVYHRTIRGELLRRASLLGAYVHAREPGPISDTDRTSFLPRDQAWGYDRAQRPPIVFQLFRDEAVIATHQRPTTPLMLDNQVVLNDDNEIILDWPELPATISSMCTGQEIEYYKRANTRIEFTHIVERTLLQNNVNTRNKFSMRATRFRETSGTSSWKPRQGSQLVRTEMTRILGQKCVNANSSLSFGRDFNTNEIKRLRGTLKGTGRTGRIQPTQQAQGEDDDGEGEEEEEDEEEQDEEEE